MNKYSVIAAGVIAGAAVFICAPAVAHDGGGGWSVTIESQPQPYQLQPYYYPAPPPVFYPQSPYVYGPPPSAFPPPADQQQWPSQQYRDPYADQSPSWRERERRENDRREDRSRDRWQDNDRPGPGARHDLPRWGYGERRR
jgi:hypothetical protein